MLSLHRSFGTPFGIWSMYSWLVFAWLHWLYLQQAAPPLNAPKPFSTLPFSSFGTVSNSSDFSGWQNGKYTKRVIKTSDSHSHNICCIGTSPQSLSSPLGLISVICRVNGLLPLNSLGTNDYAKAFFWKMIPIMNRISFKEKKQIPLTRFPSTRLEIHLSFHLSLVTIDINARFTFAYHILLVSLDTIWQVDPDFSPHIKTPTFDPHYKNEDNLMTKRIKFQFLYFAWWVLWMIYTKI